MIEPCIAVSAKPASNKVAVYNQVRTDSKMNTLDTFIHASNPYPTGRESQKRKHEMSETNDEEDTADDLPMVDSDNDVIMEPREQPRPKQVRKDVRLTSILTLRKDVKRSEHKGLTDIFANHSFVACVDDTLALIQHETNLYLVNYSVVSEELFYQVVLSEFNNFGVIYLSKPASIEECVMIAIDAEEKQGNLPEKLKAKEDIAKIISNQLVSRAEMLEQYYSMKISEDGKLSSLPMLLRGYTPTVGKLPMFLLRLGTEVNWEEEKPCFEGIARELAIMFSAEPPLKISDDEEEYDTQHKRYLWQVQHLIFPSLKNHFVAPANLVDTNIGNCITKLASLSDLYKIFERC
ncbi:DNA mismatch repair protein [Apophysomyces sp. BC1021]|nr:DNA mismatch repair protein [Apophysomyces sp. BC1021]